MKDKILLGLVCLSPMFILIGVFFFEVLWIFILLPLAMTFIGGLFK